MTKQEISSEWQVVRSLLSDSQVKAGLGFLVFSFLVMAGVSLVTHKEDADEPFRTNVEQAAQLKAEQTVRPEVEQIESPEAAPVAPAAAVQVEEQIPAVAPEQIPEQLLAPAKKPVHTSNKHRKTKSARSKH